MECVAEGHAYPTANIRTLPTSPITFFNFVGPPFCFPINYLRKNLTMVIRYSTIPTKKFCPTMKLQIIKLTASRTKNRENRLKKSSK